MARKLTYEELEQRVKELEKVVEEHRRAEEQLNIFSSLFDQSTNSIAILDPAGKVEYANPKLLNVYKTSPDKVIGQQWRSFLSNNSKQSCITLPLFVSRWEYRQQR